MSTLILSLFLAFLFGGMMLALVMGYVNSEQERVKESHARAAAAAADKVASLPQFFADPRHARGAAKSEDVDDNFVGRFEDYLRAEQALVARFVREPSIENLYRQAPASPLIQ